MFKPWISKTQTTKTSWNVQDNINLKSNPWLKSLDIKSLPKISKEFLKINMYMLLLFLAKWYDNVWPVGCILVKVPVLSRFPPDCRICYLFPCQLQNFCLLKNNLYIRARSTHQIRFILTETITWTICTYVQMYHTFTDKYVKMVIFYH